MLDIICCASSIDKVDGEMDFTTLKCLYRYFNEADLSFILT